MGSNTTPGPSPDTVLRRSAGLGGAPSVPRPRAGGMLPMRATYFSSEYGPQALPHNAVRGLVSCQLTPVTVEDQSQPRLLPGGEVSKTLSRAPRSSPPPCPSRGSGPPPGYNDPPRNNPEATNPPRDKGRAYAAFRVGGRQPPSLSPTAAERPIPPWVGATKKGLEPLTRFAAKQPLEHRAPCRVPDDPPLTGGVDRGGIGTALLQHHLLATACGAPPPSLASILGAGRWCAVGDSCVRSGGATTGYVQADPACPSRRSIALRRGGNTTLYAVTPLLCGCALRHRQ